MKVCVPQNSCTEILTPKNVCRQGFWEASDSQCPLIIRNNVLLKESTEDSFTVYVTVSEKAQFMYQEVDIQ